MQTNVAIQIDPESAARLAAAEFVALAVEALRRANAALAKAQLDTTTREGRLLEADRSNLELTCAELRRLAEVPS